MELLFIFVIIKSHDMRLLETVLIIFVVIKSQEDSGVKLDYLWRVSDVYKMLHFLHFSMFKDIHIIQ